MGSTTKAACSATKAGSGGVWSCTADLWKLGAPLGTLTLSFDVSDSKGDLAKAPAGTRTVKFTAPPPAPPGFSFRVSEDEYCNGALSSCWDVWMEWSRLLDSSSRVEYFDVTADVSGAFSGHPVTCEQGVAAWRAWIEHDGPVTEKITQGPNWTAVIDADHVMGTLQLISVNDPPYYDLPGASADVELVPGKDSTSARLGNNGDKNLPSCGV